MNFVRLTFRWFCLYFTFALPIYALVRSRPSLGYTAVVLFFLAVSAELLFRLALQLKVSQILEPGLRRVFPRLKLIREPAPFALLARGLFGSGHIYVSTGWLSARKVGEVHEHLARAEKALSRVDAPLNTLVSFLLSVSFSVVPVMWRQLFYPGLIRSNVFFRPLRTKGPLSFFIFLAFLPFIRWFGFLSPSPAPPAEDRLSLLTWPRRLNPGVNSLQFF